MIATAARWLHHHLEVGSMLFLLALVLALWAFFGIAAEVLEGDTSAFDKTILLAMRTPGNLGDPVGPLWLEEVGRDFSALGGVAVLGLLTLIVAGYLALQRHLRTMLFLLVSVAGGVMVSSLAKAFFDRPRPALVPHDSIVYTASFPSGHSMMAAVTYLTLAALLARIEPKGTVKLYLLSVAIFLTIGVGISRVYLGVHWPSDVVAGWAAGAAWALMCLGLARWLERRGQIEPAEHED
jgi:undecaprenyl-diphosphatase